MTDQAIQQLTLKELRALRSSFETHKEDTSRRLSTLETQMDRVLDVRGVDPRPKPGRSTRLLVAQCNFDSG
jgi:hypothetical protein